MSERDRQWERFRAVLARPGAWIVCSPDMRDEVIEKGRRFPGLFEVKTSKALGNGLVLAIAPGLHQAAAPSPFDPPPAPTSPAAQEPDRCVEQGGDGSGCGACTGERCVQCDAKGRRGACDHDVIDRHRASPPPSEQRCECGLPPEEHVRLTGVSRCRRPAPSGGER